MPRRHDDLFDRVASFPALVGAARTAVRGKRKKPGAAAFMANLETECLKLERELRSGRWRPGRFVTFEVREPARRLISAAPFRDRVVHHALYAVIAPLFERGFIHDSYANRVGKGTHAAVERYERFRNRYRFVLRCDIYQFFPAIDHDILKADLRRRLRCERTLTLCDAIIDHSNPQEPVELYFPGDDLFAPMTRRRGLPIGNLTSHFFQNIYLDPLDHFISERLRVGAYLRYVDDFALFTTAVLDGLRGAADATTAFDADNVVSLNELVAYIKIRVAQEKERANWRAAITPQLRDLRTNEGEFFFAWPPAGDGSRRSEETPPPVPDAQAKGPSEREVREAQEMLTAMGFAPGPVDGILGLRTRGALLRFQQEQGLVETAALDAATRQALLEAWAVQPRNVQPWAQTRREEPTPPPTGLAGFAVFTDTLVDGSPCEFCPEMVVIPGGTFTMGSPPDEEGRHDDEGPQHEVEVSRFALGRHEVTFAQYDACVAAGGCADRPDNGWGRGERPVINVSWRDAQAYVAWLTEATGQPYRLPSEAEWEFAARAGTTTPFSTGATISTSQANYDGNYTYGSGVAGEYRQQTLPVGSFDANPWGLLDMHGNVWEWVEDCWHDTYESAPTDGSAWLEANGGDCSWRVLRGGSWYNFPRFLRSAIRYRNDTVIRSNNLGFRVARTLTP